MAKHLSLGRQGELLAKNYLLNEGYKIITTNFKYQKLELDIIALKNEVLVFVEVKTRSTDFFGPPDDAVGFVKEKHIAEASEAFLINNNDLVFTDVRFDIIAILINSTGQNVRHIEDAFFPRNF